MWGFLFPPTYKDRRASKPFYEYLDNLEKYAQEQGKTFSMVYLADEADELKSDGLLNHEADKKQEDVLQRSRWLVSSFVLSYIPLVVIYWSAL